MKQKMRFTLARLMGVVLVMGLGSVALRFSSETWAGVMLLVTCGVLMVAFVGAACRGPGEWAWWLGFALSGCGYLLIAHWTPADNRPLPTIAFVDYLVPNLGLMQPTLTRRGAEGWWSLSPAVRILHGLWALALGLVGCLVSGIFVGILGRRRAKAEETRSDRGLSRPRWLRPAAVGLAAFWLIAFAAGIGRWPEPGLWAGASFLISCGLLGVAAFGALLTRVRERAPWLGAALFGFGYLILTFGKSQWFIVTPHLPTESLINNLLRNGAPPADSDFPDYRASRIFRVKGELVRKKLNLPIPMHFPEQTPLDEVLKHIRQATRDASFPGIPIYVDPVGLQLAERSMNSTVQIDIEAIPVRDALRLCLKQIGLGFSARDGFIMITNEEAATLPVYEDPLQVVGHSFLALAAALLGALAGQFVCGRRSGASEAIDAGEVRA